MFCEKELEEGSVSRILAELSAEHARQLREVSVMAWCPVEPVLAFHHAMDRIYGSGDLSVCVRAGQFSAGWALNTVLKIFLRLRSPQWLVERAASVWGRYHDSGEWEFEATPSGRIVGHLHRFEVRDVAFCARLRGWLSGAIELTGGKQPHVTEPRCVCRGHDRCSFTASWHD
jgi:hypothetical protein